MPRFLALFTLTLALSSSAEELLGPADYFAILEKSKLKYNIIREPSKTPVEALTCPRRDERTRLVVENGEKSLVEWQVGLEAMKLILEGDEHYKAERMEEAAKKWRAAIAADPEAVSAYYFLGDALLFGANDAAGALEQYRKGLALDPTIPSGHFFSASAYTRLGRMQEAREALVQALTFYPGYEGIWKIGTQRPEYWGIQKMVRHPFEPPAGYLGKKGKNGIDVSSGKDGEWLGYAVCKAAWANEPQFEGRRADAGSFSLQEERACVFNQVETTFNLTESRLAEEQKKRGVAEPSIAEADIIAALPPRERFVLEVIQAKLLDGYILFEMVGQRCPLAMSVIPDDARQELEKYIRAHVIVPAGK